MSAAVCPYVLNEKTGKICGAHYPMQVLKAWVESCDETSQIACPKGHETCSVKDLYSPVWDGESINPGNKEEVQHPKNISWWHATTVKNWEKEIKIAAKMDQRFVVHIGNRRTAECVKNFFELSPDCIGCGEVPDGIETGDWNLYELRLKPDVFIPDEFISDDEANRLEELPHPERYVNIWEFVGDVSMVVRPEHFEIVSVRPM